MHDLSDVECDLQEEQWQEYEYVIENVVPEVVSQTLKTKWSK